MNNKELAKTPVNVGIYGPTASGKTLMAAGIARALGQANVTIFDGYRPSDEVGFRDLAEAKRGVIIVIAETREEVIAFSVTNEIPIHRLVQVSNL